MVEAQIAVGAQTLLQSYTLTEYLSGLAMRKGAGAPAHAMLACAKTQGVMEDSRGEKSDLVGKLACASDQETYLLRSSDSLLPTRGESTVTMMAPYPAFSAPALQSPKVSS